MHSARNIATTLLTAVLIVLGGEPMAQSAPEVNKQLLAAFGAEVFGKKELSGLHRYMPEDYIQHNPLVPQGLTGFKQFFSDWFEAVPDWTYTLGNYSINAVDIFRVQDGKLAEHWDVIDTYGLFKQLGVIKCAPMFSLLALGLQRLPSRRGLASPLGGRLARA